MTITDVLRIESQLLILFSPPVAMAIYASATGHFTPAVQKQVAGKMFFWISLVMLVSLWGGRLILDLIGVSLAALTLTGAIILGRFSLPMVFGAPMSTLPRFDELEWPHLIAIPIIFPMSIGAAVIASVVDATARYPSVEDKSLLSLICLFHSGVIAVSYWFAGPVAKKMSSQSLKLCERLSGVFILALAIQMGFGGVSVLMSIKN